MIDRILKFDRSFEAGKMKVVLFKATFLEDFGPWKKFELVYDLKIDFYTGEMLSSDNNIVKRAFIHCSVSSDDVEVGGYELLRDANAVS